MGPNRPYCDTHNKYLPVFFPGIFRILRSLIEDRKFDMGMKEVRDGSSEKNQNALCSYMKLLKKKN